MICGYYRVLGKTSPIKNIFLRHGHCPNYIHIIQGTMDDDEWEIKYDDNDDH